jgi:hypothetical protein
MKNVRRNNNFINNKGQAVLEYVFLMFMILVVLLGIIIAISRSTQQFAQNYFGAYFTCLLEVGELPSLGADGVSSTECDDEYKPFTLADGWAPKDSSYNGSNPDSENNKNNGDKSEDQSTDYSKSSTAVSESSGTGAGNSGSSSVDNFGSRGQKVPLSNADKRGNSKSGDDDLGNSSAKNNFEQPQEFGTDGSGRSEYVPIYGRVADENKKDNATAVKADSQNDPEQALRGKRVPATAPKSLDKNEKPDEGISFPDFIKYLIIAAIILIILIFFGGQVMQYQKSQD